MLRRSRLLPGGLGLSLACLLPHGRGKLPVTSTTLLPCDGGLRRSFFTATHKLSQAEAHNGMGEAAAQPMDETTAAADPTDVLLEELDLLTSSPIPIGTLFKSLSQDARKTLGTKKMPLETFLLKYPKRYSVYKHAQDGIIMAARPEHIPETALKGKEKSADKLFEGNMDATQHAIYTVLKYIPNEWSPYVSLGIPDEVRQRCMGKKAKAFFEKYPKYFEVKAQSYRGHTFEVRRSLALQKHMAGLEKSQGRF
jgi:hypothetical protein